MPIREIVKEGNPQLVQPSKAIEKFSTPDLRTLVKDMHETMIAKEGVGIAAPQIGVNLRVIMFGFEKNDRYPGEEPVPFTILVNPWIDVLDETKEDGWEGCLSIPGIRGLVPRYKAIRYGGHDVEGNPLVREASGFHARVVQHENDHLDGILFRMRVENKENFMVEEPKADPSNIPAPIVKSPGC
ncbi:MAG: peptide deformylase [Bdellovibrionales bacterium]